MGFFFKNKKKNKEEETVTPVVETTPEVPAKEGMILVREGIKLGLPTVSMEEAIVAAGELLLCVHIREFNNGIRKHILRQSTFPFRTLVL